MTIQEYKIAKYRISTSMSKIESAIVILLPIIGLIMLSYLYFHSPINKSIFPGCIILKYTGLYCPGCGATRATYYLIHGNILKAFGFNQLYIAIIPFILYLYVLNMGIKVNGKQLLPMPKISLKFCAMLGIVFIGFCVLRNIHVYPFSILAP